MSDQSAETSALGLSEAVVRAKAARLNHIAHRHGIDTLRFASPGRLVGHVAEDRDLFDVFAFQREAGELLGGDVELFSDAVIDHDHVSPDLAAARAL